MTDTAAVFPKPADLVEAAFTTGTAINVTLKHKGESLDGAPGEGLGTGTIEQGAVSVFPPGVHETQRGELLRTIATAQTKADQEVGVNARVTDPARWHTAFVSALQAKGWPVTVESQKMNDSNSKRVTLERAIVEAVAQAGITGPPAALLSKVLSQTLSHHPNNTELALFTWESDRGVSITATINSFYWEADQLLFKTVHTRTAYSTFSTDFLFLLHYDQNVVHLQSWAATLGVP
jgi:hypothetical protein